MISLTRMIVLIGSITPLVAPSSQGSVERRSGGTPEITIRQPLVIAALSGDQGGQPNAVFTVNAVKEIHRQSDRILTVARATPAQKSKQTGPKPTRPGVTALGVTEDTELPLIAVGGLEKAPAGSRFVSVGLKFDPSIKEINAMGLVLTTPDGQVFGAAGFGNDEGEYCLDFAPGLTRSGDRISAKCAKTPFEAQKLSVAFEVPDSVALRDLRMSYGQPLGNVPSRSAEPTVLHNRLSVQVKGVAALHDEQVDGIPFKRVMFLLEVKNGGSQPYRLHSGTVQLRITSQSEKAILVPLSVGWTEVPAGTLQAIGSQKMTEEAGKWKGESKPIVTIKPGQTRTLITFGRIFLFWWMASREQEKGTQGFLNRRDIEMQFCDEHSIRLVGQ